tara:strand:+ start:27979 stop:29127 length:1149 start_codon:yes stop_codon:yes gene_type:complete
MNKILLPLAIAAVTPVAISQCTITPPGVSLAQNGVLFDDWTAPVPIGFAFTFGGATYTDMYLSDHGMAALNNGGTPAAPPAIPFTYEPTSANLGAAGTALLAPFWSDHSMFYNTVAGTNIGELWIDNTNGTSCTVTWTDVETYIDGQPFSFQMTLFNDGRIIYSYDDRVCNEGSAFGGFGLNAVVGMSDSLAPLPAPSDLSTLPVVTTNEIFEEFVTSAPLTCNPLFDLASSVLEFIPTSPGWVVVYTPPPAVCAAKVTYGTGCGGLEVDSNLPMLGTNWDITTSNVDPISPVAITFFGNSQVNLPLTLVFANADPMCSVYINTILGSLSAPAAAGVATASLAIPSNPVFAGSILTAQSMCLTLANPANILTSNGLEGTIGN